MRTGLRDIDPRLKNVVTLYGGSAVSTLWYVRLRSGLPALFAGLRIAAPGRDSGRHPCWVRKRRAGHRVRPAGCNRSWHSFRTMGCGTGCNVLFRGHVRTGCATGANADGEGGASNAATGARNGATMGRHAVGRHGLYAAAGDLAVPAMAGRCLTNPVPAAFRYLVTSPWAHDVWATFVPAMVQTVPLAVGGMIVGLVPGFLLAVAVWSCKRAEPLVMQSIEHALHRLYAHYRDGAWP